MAAIVPAGDRYYRIATNYNEAPALGEGAAPDAQLRWMVTNLLEEDVAGGNSDVWTAFEFNGIETYLDFASLSEDDITALNYNVTVQDDDDIIKELPRVKKRRLVIAQLYHRWVQDQMGVTIRVDQLDRQGFAVYRVSYYQQHRESLKAGSKNEVNPELDKWNKNLKVTRSEYIEFKDAAYFTRWKEEMITTAESQNLLHTLVAPPNPSPNRDLDQAQCKWMYKTLRDKAVHPKARSIVLKHVDTKDSRAVWTAICAHFEEGVVATVSANSLSAYLSSTRLDKIRWKGTQAGYITHFTEQLRMHNKIDPGGAFNDKQSINLLRIAVSGVDNLAIVHTTEMSARRAAGVRNAWTYDEYAAAVTAAAELYDSSRQAKYGTPQLQGQVHEFHTDDGNDVQDYEVEYHDIDTPVEDLLAFQAVSSGSNRPPTQRKLHLGSEAWSKLSSDDRSCWIRMSPEGKDIIAEHLKSEGRNSVKNPPPPPSANFQRNSFTHEQLSHDADLLALTNTPKSEASNHDSSTKEHSHTPQPGMDITKMLASAHKLSKGDKKPSSGSQEGNQMMWGRPHGYEVNVHERVHDPNMEWYLSQCSMSQQPKRKETAARVTTQTKEIENSKSVDHDMSTSVLKDGHASKNTQSHVDVSVRGNDDNDLIDMDDSRATFSSPKTNKKPGRVTFRDVGHEAERSSHHAGTTSSRKSPPTYSSSLATPKVTHYSSRDRAYDPQLEALLAGMKGVITKADSPAVSTEVDIPSETPLKRVPVDRTYNPYVEELLSQMKPSATQGKAAGSAPNRSSTTGAAGQKASKSPSGGSPTKAGLLSRASNAVSKVVGKMSGPFSGVEKPEKTKDRIVPKKGGGFKLTPLEGLRSKTVTAPLGRSSPNSDSDLTDTGSIRGNDSLKTLAIGPTSAAVSSLSEQSEDTSGTYGSGDSMKPPKPMSDRTYRVVSRNKGRRNKKPNKICTSPCARFSMGSVKNTSSSDSSESQRSWSSVVQSKSTPTVQDIPKASSDTPHSGKTTNRFQALDTSEGWSDPDLDDVELDGHGHPKGRPKMT